MGVRVFGGAVFWIPVFTPTSAGGEVWSNHLTFRGPPEPAAVIVMEQQQTCTQKGTLPYILIFSPCGNPVNVDPVLAVSASGVIGENLLSVISMDWKPICV